jgi:hypothetical protein
MSAQAGWLQVCPESSSATTTVACMLHNLMLATQGVKGSAFESGGTRTRGQHQHLPGPDGGRARHGQGPAGSARHAKAAAGARRRERRATAAAPAAAPAPAVGALAALPGYTTK